MTANALARTGRTRAAVVIIGAIAAIPVVAEAQRDSGPPVPYEDVGACPFEGCVYREWIARRAVSIYRDRNVTSPIVARLTNGEKVQAITGIVVTLKPGTVRFNRRWTGAGTHMERRVLVHDRLEAEPGEVLYLLTYQGEGFTKAWLKGRFVENVDISAFFDPRCASDSNVCSGQMIAPTRVWWVQIKTKSGKIGWTNRADQDFGNIDALG
jgi:hypothetical protein